jgi:hypothetical protein
MMVFFRPTVPREGCYHKVACSSKVANAGFAPKADGLARRLFIASDGTSRINKLFRQE